ncbi:MAG: hypothetical protein KKA22_00275 [Gammaproteobacteria bacterium]|nr:hypothetical protein [Gammaproteobacteria bacterium]MBU1406570.1 hypothetical protein [Gammaproteobacteria bacterium]MBU1530878.1 hypothetical protein [Gammaproteobacteria bacterium]
MTAAPSIFLDTNILKASVDSRLALLPRHEKITWGDRDFEIEVHSPVRVNQNTKFLAQGNHERFQDTVALRYIAAFAKERKIALLTHEEVIFELMGLPRATGGKMFYGAPISKVPGPIQYSRIIFDGSGEDHQYEFLCQIQHPRFKELQRICGAYQGIGKPPHRNQLLDAFHILCAEHASASYFVTLDNKLIRMLTKRQTPVTAVTPITPKQLLITLVTRRPTWLWSFWREKRRLAKSGRRLELAVQDASDEWVD